MRYARPGQVEWIGLRPARRTTMDTPVSAQVGLDGLAGDRARGGKRAVTLIQAEHLPVISALCGRSVTAAMLRRNIVVSGLNLLALKGRQVRLGGALIEVTGPCHPCSRIEEALGLGGYSAMRGHGGLCASVVEPGHVALGDRVAP